MTATRLLVACGGGADGTTRTSSGANTAGVMRAYSVDEFNASVSVNANTTARSSCAATDRTLVANGIPDHATGTFPNPDNPNTRICADADLHESRRRPPASATRA